jgi:hypothetical protein
MPILAGLMAILFIWLLYKMFIDGWLFKSILFVFGWIGLYVVLASNGADQTTAMTLGNDTPVSMAALVPTVICLLCLLCTKVEK